MLSDRELLLLENLAGHDWMRLMDVGGHCRSWHSGVMARLVRRGLVTRHERWRGARATYLYRISDAGEAERIAASEEGDGDAVDA